MNEGMIVFDPENKNGKLYARMFDSARYVDGKVYATCSTKVPNGWINENYVFDLVPPFTSRWDLTAPIYRSAAGSFVLKKERSKTGIILTGRELADGYSEEEYSRPCVIFIPQEILDSKGK